MAVNAQKIGIIGIGMVGGPLARYFEEFKNYRRGQDLFLYDIDLQKGFFDDINLAEVIFISVPTPRGNDGAARLEAVESAVKRAQEGKIIVIKSTVPPGTTEEFQKRYPQQKFLFNPEFLTEVNAWENTAHPDRQFVGFTAQSRGVAGQVLALLPDAQVMAPSPGFELTATEAEIIKYAANMFLTRKVTFANAIYDLAKQQGADYEKVRLGISSDPRIGPSHLDVLHQGYRGYGGYCFTKDTDALIAHCRKAGLERCAGLFASDRLYNAEVLREQGLTPEDVSVHDHEWIQKKLKTNL